MAGAPEHLCAPQKFSLRPSAADENIFARVREARALHHNDSQRASAAPATGETRLTRSQNGDSPEPLITFLPTKTQTSSSSAPAPLMLSAIKHDSNPFLNTFDVIGSSPSPPLPSPKSKSTSTSPRAVLTTVVPPPARSSTARKRGPARAGTRSASPNSQKHVVAHLPSRPSSFSSTTSVFPDKDTVKQRANATKQDELPQQVAISPRREQSALVSQMVVAESGGVLAGGSVRALLEWAVKTRDVAAQADLLFTFRLCAPAEELFTAWCDMATDALYRSRLMEFLRIWLSGYFVMDFCRKPLFGKVLRAVESHMQPEDVTNVKLLCLNSNFRFGNTGVAALRKQAVERMLVASGGLPQAIAVETISDKALAEQLTFISSHLFRNLCPSELVEWVLKGQRTDEAAPHITEIIGYSARLSAWVTTEAVKGTPLKRLVGLGQRLQVLGNFEALRAVLNGLQHRAVVRLAAAWEALPADELAAFDALEDLLSAAGNFQLYRQTLKLRGNQPVVPVLGIALHDLTVANQRGQNAYLLPNGMLSAAFVARIGTPLRELQQFQRNEPYSIAMVPALVNWLLNVKPMDDEELAALAVPTLQHSGSAPKLVVDAKPPSGESENANPKGLRRALSARSLNGFLADLIRRTDEPADLKERDASSPPKDKDRVAQP